MKKRMYAFLLAAMVGLSACDRNAPQVDLVSSHGELYISRAQSSTVYGVETPDSTEHLVLDESLPQEQSSSASQQPAASQAPSSQPAAQAPSSQPAASQAASSQVAASQAAPSKAAPSQAPAPSSQAASSQASSTEQKSEQQAVAKKPAKAVSDEVRAVWMSYITLDPMIRNKNKAEFTSNIDRAFAQIAAFGLNTVYVQVRPFGDALYKSDYFPWSSYLTGTEGQNPGYDPLSIMCSLADSHGLRIEAWINPYRVRTDSSRAMSADNPAKKWLEAGNGAALKWKNGVYYNPGSTQARKLIVNGVREIVANYDVDGIHFDDYFYPTTDMSFDSETYRASGSSLSQADWRRENVNILLREVYAAIKQIDSGCLFGVSPQANNKNNYDVQFADCAKWLANTGYLDYICPQVYFGFENSSYPYADTVDSWNRMIRTSGVDLYVGIAVYKLGQTDQWAGSGKNEWLDTTDILARMVETAREASHYQGVAFYSYEGLFGSSNAQVRAEKENLKALM